MRHLIISDIDGTVNKGSLVLDHAGFLESKGIIDTKGLYQQWKNDKKNENLIYLLAVQYKDSLKNKKVKELLVEEFMDTVVFSHINNFYTYPLEVVSKSKNTTKDVYFISGSPDFLVSEFCKRMRAITKNPRIEGFGSNYLKDNGVLSGEVVGMFDFESKKAKIKEVRNNFSYGLNTIGMGDTSSDFAIFENCFLNILVEPTDETILKANAKKIVYKTFWESNDNITE